MHTPEVSVCVPTYNGAAFLGSTLESIAAQTFEDFEVLIVDDQSTDATIAVAESYAASDARARVIRNAERAGSSARNANQCLRHARGRWIKFLFQDDLMAPSCLARMLDAGRQRGQLVMAWHDFVFEPDVDETVRRFYESPLSLATTLPGTAASADAVCDAVLSHWGVNFIGPTSASLIHRDCVARHGSFHSEIRDFPDLEYWIRVGNRDGLAIVPERLVTFRVHGSSISARIRDERRAHPALPLDPLRLLLAFARAPEYANLRHRALRRDPPVDPEQLLRSLAFETRWLAADVRYRRRTAALVEQWEAFCSQHPEMHALLRDIDASMSRWAKAKRWVKGKL